MEEESEGKVMTLDEIIKDTEEAPDWIAKAFNTLALEVKKLKERVFLDELKADSEKVNFAEMNGIVNRVEFNRGDRVGRAGRRDLNRLGKSEWGQVLAISKGRVRVQWGNNAVSWIKPSSLVKIA